MCSAKAVMLTRPEGANTEFAIALDEIAPDIPIIKFPLSKRVPTGAELSNLDDYDAIIVTSRAALDLVKADFEDVPAFVVGSQSYDWLKSQGAKPYDPELSAKALYHRILESDAKKLLYLRGEDINFSFKRAFANSDKLVDEVIIYRIENLPVEKLDFTALAPFDHLLLPIFSLKSFLRLERILPNIQRKTILILPISANVEEAIRIRGYQSPNFTILKSLAKAGRNEMLREIESQFKLL